MKHKKLAVSCASVLFAAILAVSACLVCTVREIKFSYACVTEITETEMLEFKKELDGYIGKNAIAVDKHKVKEHIEQNPYVKVNSVKVKALHILSVDIEERLESYCVRTTDGFYFIATDGTVLAKRQENSARADLKPLASIVYDDQNLEIGENIPNDALFQAAVKIINKFTDSRNEIKTVTVSKYNGNAVWNRLFIKTADGATFTVSEATVLVDEKADLVFQVYNSLIGEDRTNREIQVFTAENNTVDYE